MCTFVPHPQVVSGDCNVQPEQGESDALVASHGRKLHVIYNSVSDCVRKIDSYTWKQTVDGQQKYLCICTCSGGFNTGWG
jgi:hypothetical protein